MTLQDRISNGLLDSPNSPRTCPASSLITCPSLNSTAAPSPELLPLLPTLSPVRNLAATPAPSLSPFCYIQTVMKMNQFPLLLNIFPKLLSLLLSFPTTSSLVPALEWPLSILIHCLLRSPVLPHPHPAPHSTPNRPGTLLSR